MAITVKTHVGRDVLQNADYFNNIGKVVIEYVTNALDAGILSNQAVKCEVSIKRNGIVIKDNACGMTYNELNNNFFTMHGENVFRKRTGVKPRGRFGTGKIAAFGIANKLRVESIKDNLKNIVELTRKDLEEATGSEPIPVTEIEINKTTKHVNGTIIKISDFHTLKRADTHGAVSELKRALHKYLEKHIVIVNGQRILFEEPSYKEVYSFFPYPFLEKIIGRCELKIKIAKSPVEENLNGIFITANGWLLETTLADLEGKPFTDLLFGEVEIPMLEEDTGKVRSYDNTRTLRLNRNNELVRNIIDWLKECLESVRTKIAEEHKNLKESEEMQKLQEEAKRIEEILNEDYDEYRNELIKANPNYGNDTSTLGPQSKDLILEPGFIDGNSVSVLTSDNGILGKNQEISEDKRDRGEPLESTKDFSNYESEDEVNDNNFNKDEQERKKRKKTGGFKIDFRHHSENAMRSSYNENERLIIINLDHPQVEAIMEEYGSIENRLFRVVTNETAFTEYALVIVNELAKRGISIHDAFDALVESRNIIDRVSRRAAIVYGRTEPPITA